MSLRFSRAHRFSQNKTFLALYKCRIGVNNCINCSHAMTVNQCRLFVFYRERCLFIEHLFAASLRWVVHHLAFVSNIEPLSPRQTVLIDAHYSMLTESNFLFCCQKVQRR